MKRLAMIAVMVGMMGCEDAAPPVVVSPPPAAVSAAPTIEQIAREFAMEKVTPVLHAPATADYPLATVKAEKVLPFENLNGETVERWLVRGGVDAHNLNGAFIRNSWQVTLIRAGDTFKPVEVELKKSTVFIDDDYQRVFLVREMERRRAAEKAEADRIALAVEDLRDQLLTIDDEIEQSECALTQLPERPAGGPVYGVVEAHRKLISNLRFQKKLIQERLAEIDAPKH